MENKLVIIGGGGHFKSVADSLLSSNNFDDVCFLSNEEDIDSIFGIKRLGNDSKLEELFNDGWKNAFLAVGSVGDTSTRNRLANKLLDIGFNIVNIIDKTAIVSDNSLMGKGLFIGKGAIINANSKIEDFAIINSGSIVEHDCKVGKFVHISPNACICGDCTIGDNTHIGANTVVKQGTTIGSNTIIGMGSVVTKDIDSNVVAYGNPCKVIGK